MKICPRCKLKNPIDAMFCGTCGHGFTSIFISPPKIMPVTPPPVAFPWDVARARQAPQVLQDAHYLLDTGLCMGCPRCGSTNLSDVGKATGTGMWYFGSIAWVLTMSALDSLIARGLSGHQIKCNYCGTTFTL